MRAACFPMIVLGLTATVVHGQEPLNPFPRRPVCASLFLKSEWQLSSKQKACDWAQNRLFSVTGLAAAAWSAGYSQVTERATDRGKGTTGFTTRFSENFAQSALKGTGFYLGGLVFREDPRRDPPFLVLRSRPHPRGFWRRAGHALATNFIAYRCTGTCAAERDIRKVPALSRVAGSLASGFSSELWAPDRLNTPGRALRRSASAYGGTFADSLFVEFKPELGALAGKVVTAIFGVK